MNALYFRTSTHPEKFCHLLSANYRHIFVSKYVHFYIRYCLNLLRVNVLHIYLKTLADVP